VVVKTIDEFGIMVILKDKILCSTDRGREGTYVMSEDFFYKRVRLWL
jgi:hypothetical protein